MGSERKLVLAAMIFAVSMTFIDQTIVAIAVPSLQDDLSLVSHDFALASRTVFYVMAGVMVVAFFVSLATMPADRAAQASEPRQENP